MNRWNAIKNLFSKITWYDRTLWRNYLSYIGVISSLVTITSFIITAQFYPANIICASIFIVVLFIIFIKMWYDANNLDEVHLKINGTKIIVKIGDIFELMGKDAETKKKEICVIPVNDYFDVIVDNRIVSETTLHGQYINRLIANDKLGALNKIIEEDEVLNAPENKTENPNREKGKKISYKLGSLIEFESYILAAFTKFDSKNKAFLSAEEYSTFWMRFWENTDQIYAGRTINLPLVGAGVTRFRNGKPSKQELLETMLWSLKISGFHNTYGFRSINIIIYKADASDIDFFHIQHNPNFR